MRSPATALSIIVAALNDAPRIAATLRALAPMRARGVEVIVVDGGSDDETAALATPLADRVLTAPPTRAARMNAGAGIAKGYVLLFLPAGIWLPPDADLLILHGPGREQSTWGHFDIDIKGEHRLLPLVSWLISAHSRASGFATAEQALFMTREAFIASGGFPDLAAMEDIAVTDTLNALSPPLCLRTKVHMRGRSFEQDGFWTTTWRLLRVRLAHLLGVRPEKLARLHAGKPKTEPSSDTQQHETGQDHGTGEKPDRPDWLLEKHNRNRRAE